jgi:hypothetical protein
MASCRSPWEQDRYELLLTTRRKSAGCGGALMLAEPTTEVVTEWATTHPEVVTQSLRIDLVADLLRLLLSDNEARSEGVLAPVQEIVASLERIVSETFGTPIRVRPPYETDLTSRESRPPVGFADVDRALVVAMESHRISWRTIQPPQWRIVERADPRASPAAGQLPIGLSLFSQHSSPAFNDLSRRVAQEVCSNIGGV